MTEPNIMKKMGATPGKLALIGVLAVVLITVIMGQLPESKIACNEPAPTGEQSKSQKTANSSLGKGKEKLAKSLGNKKKMTPHTWTELSLANIVAFDPMAKPDWLIAAEEAAINGGDESYLTEKSHRESSAIETCALV